MLSTRHTPLVSVKISVAAGEKSYTLVKNGNDWKATKPAKLEVDATKVTPIAGAFKDWKGTGFADDQSPKGNGLAKPKAVISAQGATKGTTKGTKPACLIRVGDESADKASYVVATATGPDVYLAPKWAIDRILVKPDDLKKAGAAAAAPAAKPTKPGGAKVTVKK